MRYLFPVLLFLAVAASVSAQGETLIRYPFEYGGYAAPVVRFTAIRDDLGMMAGGRAGIIVNHYLGIGVGGYTLVNGIPAGVSAPDTLDLEMTYGGLELDFTGRSDRLVHFRFSTLVGAGLVRLNEKGDRAGGDFATDRVGVVEPVLDVEMNITSFLRVNAGGGYRFVWDVDTPGLDDEALSGPIANISLRVGKF